VVLGLSALSHRGVSGSSPWPSALWAAVRATAAIGLCCCVLPAGVEHDVAKDLSCKLACGVYTLVLLLLCEVGDTGRSRAFA
jgi:hypothetical protein